MGKPRFGQLFGVLSSETTGVQTISGSLTVNGVLIANEISGSGAGLTNIPASGITGLNLSQISSGSVSASISPNNGLRINTNTTIVGDLMIQGTASISYLNVTYESASVIYSSGSNQFGDAADDTQTLYGTVLIQTGSLTVTGSVTSTAGFTGSLFGTSSWATNATTASYILNAVSSSYSATASYVESAQTASYVLNAVSASYAQTASYIQLSGVDGFTNYSSSVSSRVSSLENFSSSLDATFATDAQLNAATASLSSSIASLSSSYLNTSSSFSNGINANSSSISALSSSFISFSASYNTGSFTGSFTGNLQGTSSWAVNAQTASFAPNYVLTSVTSSMLAPYVLTSQTSSMSVASASVATSASYALTASFALNGGGGAAFPFSGSAVISGSLFVSSSTTNVLTIQGSGSAQPIFTVQGSAGQLFAITDSLSGSLFSVNDISGLPILEVFSDNTTLIGDYQAPALYTTKRVTSVAGNNVIYSLATSSYDGAFFDYVAKSGSNARAGNIMALWSGTSVNFTETTTTDFGDTSGLAFTAFISGSNLVLSGSTSTANWNIKTIIRSI